MRRAAVALALLSAGCGGSAFLTDSQEYFAGRAVAATAIQEYGVIQDEDLTEYVSLVGHSIALASDRPDTFNGYVFGVLNADEANAVAGPGGFILVTKGLLKLCESEDELAGVLAHELAHVNLEHPERALDRARASAEPGGFLSGLSLGLAVGGTAVREGERKFGRRSSGIGERVQWASATAKGFSVTIDGFMTEVFVKGYERDQELDADRLGADLLSRPEVGYNPWALADLLKRMAAKPTNQKYGWMSGSTHPHPKDRLAAVEAHLRERGVTGKTDPARTRRFEEKTRKFRR